MVKRAGPKGFAPHVLSLPFAHGKTLAKELSFIREAKMQEMEKTVKGDE